MRLAPRWTLALACMTAFSCQTITEEMPGGPSSSSAPGGPSSIPIVVTQIPIPSSTGPVSSTPVPSGAAGTPAPVPTSSNSQPGTAQPGVGGGGGGSNPAPTATPAPTPVVVSQPAPTSQPVPTVTVPSGQQEPPPSGNGNTGEMVSIHAHVYYVVCGDNVIPNSKFAEEANVGCQVRLDATPKDSKNKAVVVDGTPNWTFEGTSYPVSAKNPYTPILTGTGPGEFTAFCELNGVRSNTFSFRFR